MCAKERPVETQCFFVFFQRGMAECQENCKPGNRWGSKRPQQRRAMGNDGNDEAVER